MDERRQLIQELDEIQQAVKELEIHYEQYFSGIERREPYNERKAIVRRIRHFTNRHIVWTDLKFRYQSIASRFMSYGQYWDRILRLIDEGKYHRHTSKLRPPTTATRANKTKAIDPKIEAAKLQQELSQARKTCGLSGDAPSAEKVARYLSTQREKIRDRYGDKPVVFSIDSSGEKPRIKVSLKK
ncbi:MAG: MXAN_5187 C-terminal domain-containing protein [Thermodesulfobacteriota bacterium]|nr:MXAN_5187 C-terminal domain-containing protein [Thermodesulfobacteriota bacterium]